jgi:hypothetical protein
LKVSENFISVTNNIKTEEYKVNKDNILKIMDKTQTKKESILQNKPKRKHIQDKKPKELPIKSIMRVQKNNISKPSNLEPPRQTKLRKYSQSPNRG